MEKNISILNFSDEPVIPNTCIYAVRYDLRHGDVMKSAQLVQAARENAWDQVNALLDAGADPRICRWSDGVDTVSGLYLAIEQELYSMARRLYEAGDRLDDLHLEQGKVPNHVLLYVQTQMNWGRNLLVDDSKPLSECARCTQVQRCRELVPSASAEELSLAAQAIAVRIYHGWENECWEIISLLQEHGADFTPAKAKMVQLVTVLKSAPTVLQLEPEFVADIENFIAKI